MTGADFPGPLYRAVVEYDGTDFLGFQIQAEGRTVQGELERAAQRLTQQPVRVIGSGRTDTGVHAAGQVIVFRTTWRHTTADLLRGLNALLPSDLSVLSLDLAPATFHPRFSARERWYRYQVGQWPRHSPLRARYAWEIPDELDVDAMNAASGSLLGTHDFATFGQPTQGENTIRHLSEAHWRREPPYLYFDIRGNAFLRHMVRTLVGTLVRVGRSQLTPDAFTALFSACQRALAAPPAPPQGLILMAVTYPSEDLQHLSGTPVATQA